MAYSLFFVSCIKTCVVLGTEKTFGDVFKIYE